jgi:uncharacterized membrane protein
VVIDALHQGLRISRQARNLLVITDRLVAQQVASSDAETAEALLLVRFCVTLIAPFWPHVSRRFPRPWYVITDLCMFISRRHGMACGVSKDGWVVRCRHGKTLQGW